MMCNIGADWHLGDNALKCKKCHSHMAMTRSETTHKCVQIWYECPACGSHMLSSTPAEIFDIRDTQLGKKQLNSVTPAIRRFHTNGASIN